MWLRGLERLIGMLKVAGLSPSSGSELTFHSGLLLTEFFSARGSSLERPVVDCLLCYLGRVAHSFLSAWSCPQVSYIFFFIYICLGGSRRYEKSLNLEQTCSQAQWVIFILLQLSICDLFNLLWIPDLCVLIISSSYCRLILARAGNHSNLWPQDERVHHQLPHHHLHQVLAWRMWVRWW
jgi:hypothetical protein